MKHPKTFFEKVLTMSSFPPNSSLYLPAPFVRKHGLHKVATLRSVESGRSFTVKINVAYPRNRPSALFQGGWKAFAAANELAFGDRLLFVLVAQSSFDVYIHRCGGSSASYVDVRVPVQRIDSHQSSLTSEAISMNKPKEPDVAATILKDTGDAQVLCDMSFRFYELVKQNEEKDCIICRLASMTQHGTMKRFHTFANA